MATQRLMSRFNVSEKKKGELSFIGQCVIAAGVVVAIVAYAFGY